MDEYEKEDRDEYPSSFVSSEVGSPKDGAANSGRHEARHRTTVTGDGLDKMVKSLNLQNQNSLPSNSGPDHWQELQCDCFRDWLSWLWVTWCPWGAACIQSFAVGQATGRQYAMPFLCNACCCCIGAAINRMIIRKKFGISGNYFADCLLYTCCGMCMVCQEYREVERRNAQYLENIQTRTKMLNKETEQDVAEKSTSRDPYDRVEMKVIETKEKLQPPSKIKTEEVTTKIKRDIYC